MSPQNKIISDLYNFINLSAKDQFSCLYDFIEHSRCHNSFSWPSHRCVAIPPFCKNLLNIPLTFCELEIVKNIDLRIQNISSIEDLDICLMFWLISKDEKYKQHIIDTEARGDFQKQTRVIIDMFFS